MGSGVAFRKEKLTKLEDFDRNEIAVLSCNKVSAPPETSERLFSS